MNKTFLFYNGLSLLNVMVLKGLSVKLHIEIFMRKLTSKIPKLPKQKIVTVGSIDLSILTKNELHNFALCLLSHINNFYNNKSKGEK